MRFRDLFSAFGSRWPTELFGTSWPPSGDVTGLLDQINDSIELHDVITDVASSGRVTVNATLKAPSPPARTEIVGTPFPSLRFVFSPDVDWSSGFRASTSLDGTFSLQIDALPLELLVPSDMLAAHQDSTMRQEEFGIELTTSLQHSVISRTFSLTVEATGELRLIPHVPISIGPCTLFGLSMRAVHDLQLIPSPERAVNWHDWIVRPLVSGAFPMGVGGLGIGGVEFDWSDQDSTIAAIRSRLKIADFAEVVLEDLVIPAAWVPIPVYGTGGIRKSLQPGESVLDHVTFADSPVLIPLGESHHIFLNQMYFQMPAEEEPVLSGLSIEGGVAVDAGGDDSDGDEDWEAALGLISGDLLRVSFGRTPPNAEEEVPLLRLDLFSHSITIFRLRVGVSISGLQASEFDIDALQALIDIAIEEKKSDSDEDDTDEESGSNSPVRIESEDGRPFVAILSDVGLDRGKPTANIDTPKGATLVLGRFALILHEIALTAENGATYISISGGFREKIDPFTGKLWFTRLRGKLAGNPDAPEFKLGGIGVELEKEDVAKISAHGHYREELLSDGTLIKEQGLGGMLVIHAGSNQWGLSVDVFWGERIPQRDPKANYLLFQVVLFGALPVGPIELRQIEALYADSLLPKIEEGDREAGELKYYSWLNRAKPTAASEERGLTAWTPQNDAWAFGLGLGISFTGCGDCCLLTAFGLGFNSEDADGLVIALELRLFGGEKALALGIFEYDFRTDAFVLQIQIDLTLDELIDNFPEQLNVRLGGTFVFGNKPGLVAIGRIDHVDTWIGAKIVLDLSSIAELKIHLALCFEWLEGVHIGGGFTFSISAKGDLGVIRLEGWGSLLVVVKCMTSGTNDFVARIRFDAGFALELFGFLRFGISVSLLADWLAHAPNFFVFRATFRLETPWFLPDVSCTLESVKGDLVPSARSMLTSALLDASARSSQGSKSIRVGRSDGKAGGSQPQLFSINELRITDASWHGESDLIPLDATIEIQFSPMLQDMIGLGSIVTSADLGRQVAGDDEMQLIATYQLVGLEVRRRPLGETTWERIESITSAESPRKLRWLWDCDTRTGGEIAPKKLLLNGATPFTVAYENPVADNEILTEHPNFPCCDVRPPDVALFDFSADALGVIPNGLVRHFDYTQRASRAPVRIMAGPCAVRPPEQPGADNDRVGCFLSDAPQINIASRENLGIALINVAMVDSRSTSLVVIARNRIGEIVFRSEHNANSFDSALPFVNIEIEPDQPFRSIEIKLLSQKERLEDDSKHHLGSIVLDYVECITSADLNRFNADTARCERIQVEGEPRPVTFLAQHEYEIAITTRLSIEHTSTEPESTEIVERVGFITAGPPGLNLSPEPGLELEPHVVSANAGGNGILYREESVHLVLNDAMQVFGPGPGGFAEDEYQLPVTMTVAPEITANPEDSPERSSFTADEWFLARRGVANWLHAAVFFALEPAVSEDPLRLRYRYLSEASGGTCTTDELWIEQRPRLGVSPFDSRGRELWEPRTTYHAAMRPEGGPVVDRKNFEPDDLAAFTRTEGLWMVEDGRLIMSGTASATFGDTDWDLYHLELHADVRRGGALSAAVLIEPGDTHNGIRFTLDHNVDGSARLMAVATGSSTVLGNVTIDAVPDTLMLSVDTFVDQIQCTCGGMAIRVPRSGRGPGVCELGGTSASVRSLRIYGLEMYGFNFTTSRYTSFADHIASSSGAGEYQISDSAELLDLFMTREAGEITNAMQPTSSDADRERVFAQTASSLAMPLREDPDQFHIEVGSRGTDRWLLLESPEPIDFVSEVTLKLQRKKPIEPVETVLAKKVLDTVRKQIEGDWPLLVIPVRRESGLAGRFDIPDNRTPLNIEGSVTRDGLLNNIEDRRRFEEPSLSDGGRISDDVSGEFTSRLLAAVEFTLEVVFSGIRYTNMRKGMTRTIRTNLTFSLNDRNRLKGVVLGFDASGKLIDLSTDNANEWVDVGVIPIQNADATKVFLLPRTAGQLPDGCYRAGFHIERKWFETTEATGPENTYIDDGVVKFLVGSRTSS